MKNRYRKVHASSTYRRFALSFLAVLILPVALFSFLFLNNFYRIYQDKIIEQAQISLDTAMNGLERELAGLWAVASYNSQLSYFEDYAIQKNYTAKEITEALGAEVGTHSILENIYYYDTINQGIVYSKGGTYSLSYFVRFYVGTENTQQMLEILDNMEDSRLQVWKGEKYGLDGNLPNLFYVIQSSSGKWWFFTISQKSLREILDADSGVTVLLDTEDTQIFPLEKPLELVDDSTYYTITSESSDHNFKLVRTISTESLFADLYRWQNYFFVMLVVVLLVGSVLIFGLSSYNERPVRELQYYCKEMIQNIPNTLEGFEMFRFAMKKMEDKAWG